MDISPWELAFGFICHIISLPPVYIYWLASGTYKRIERMIQVQLTHTKAWRDAREAREAANRAHPFMRLPGELRNRIYTLSMVSDVVLDPVWGQILDLKEADEKESFLETPACYPNYRSRLYYDERGFERNGRTAARMTNMSQVCRAWRDEAVRHYYGSNIFKFPIGTHLSSRNRGQGWFSSPVPTAERTFYTRWLYKFPRLSFPVLRLVLHDYRSCPHPCSLRIQGSMRRRLQLRTRIGGCMILLDFEQRKVSAVKGISKDSIELWDCETCWRQYVDAVWSLNGSEDLDQLFDGFDKSPDAKHAIRAIDCIRSIIQGQLDK